MPDNKEKKEQDKQQQDAPVKPDPKTLHTPDPQEKMEGPVSSLMHNVGEGFDTDKSKEEADEEKDEHM